MKKVEIPLEYLGKKVIIYDIDNTLIDVRERYLRSIEDAGGDPLKGLRKLGKNVRRKFWKIFLSSKYLHLDKPSRTSIEELNRKYDEGHVIILLTGRPEHLREDTIDQLNRFGVRYHMLLMRPENNREPDYVYKVEVIRRLKNMGLKIVEYHEDDPKTVEIIKRLYPEIKVFRHDISKERFFFHNS